MFIAYRNDDQNETIEGIFDTKKELANFLGVTVTWIYMVTKKRTGKIRTREYTFEFVEI